MSESYACSDLTGRDFREEFIDLSDCSLAKSIITGCRFLKCTRTQFFGCIGRGIDFAGVDVTNANFDKSDSGVILSLVGSVWNGVEITKVSDWLSKESPRWCFVTNAFVNIGCLQKTIEEWEAIGASRQSLEDWASTQEGIDVEGTWNWWLENARIIRERATQT